MDRIDCIKHLVERNAFVHLYDPAQSEYSPLFQCIKLGNFPALEILCDSGVNLDNMRDSLGFSPLTFAVKLNLDHIANYISLRVKNLDDEDPEGLTAFARNALTGKLDQASKLLQRGANINYSNRDGKTALALAILAENE